MRIKQGFSLWEVTIVLALVTMVVLIPLTYKRVCDRSIVRLEVQKLSMLIRSLQRQALVSGSAASVVFDCLNNRYTVYGVHGEQDVHSLASGVQFGVIDNCYGPPSAPTKVITKPCTFTNDCMTILADGTISSGAIYIKDTSGCIGYAVTCGVEHFRYIRCYYCTDVRHWRLVS